MTEEEWRTSIDLARMLQFAGEALRRERKLWLFAVGCCRRLDRLLVDDSRSALATAERFADGEIGKARLKSGRTLANTALVKQTTGLRNPLRSLRGHAALAVCHVLEQGKKTRSSAGVIQAWQWVSESARCAGYVLTRSRSESGIDWTNEWGHQFQLLRCVVGSITFRPAAIEPAILAWNNATVVKLARTIYEDRQFELMPILGDALEDAFCDNAEILDHCRGPGPHVRGCWVVDLILGKE